jgi:hypothetical protein
MFNLLSMFEDFPNVTINIYTYTETYDSDTGQITGSYTLDSVKDCFAFQRSAIQWYIRGKMFDDVDVVFIMDSPPAADNIICFDGLWYNVLHADNIAFTDSVYTVGAGRIEKPILAE